jgi:hypothetical protein
LPPEQPPYLVILDTRFGDDSLKGKVEYVTPAKSAGIPEFVQVKWGLSEAPRDVGKALRAAPRRSPLPFDADETPEFGVFLSYRRKDDRWAAGRINDRLIASFGIHAVFRDVDAIKPGKDFRHEIDA